MAFEICLPLIYFLKYITVYVPFLKVNFNKYI